LVGPTAMPHVQVMQNSLVAAPLTIQRMNEYT
jgi:hypothetical protein